MKAYHTFTYICVEKKVFSEFKAVAYSFTFGNKDNRMNFYFYLFGKVRMIVTGTII